MGRKKAFFQKHPFNKVVVLCKVEQARERAVSRERAAQSKVLDLETQLSRNKTELNQLHRSKEDVSGFWGILLLYWWCPGNN